MPPLPDLIEIKQIRRKLNISQRDLEEELNIPQATISRIENGIGNPSYLSVKKIFDYLDNLKSGKKNSEKKAKDIKSNKIISIVSKATIKEAVNLMNEYKFSQLPIIDNNQNIGSITSKKIQKIIIDHPEMITAEIDVIKELPFPEIEKDWDIKNISGLLTNYPAVLVKEKGEYTGIITDADLLKLA